ncbi:hypothetical protein EMCRGX_G023303 [Ephydatia muelleri]
MLKHSLGELPEHECIKMEEDTPRHWASCRRWSCGLSLKNVLWITSLCVISTCLAVYVSGKSIVGNNAQHRDEAPQIQITSTMASHTNVLTDQTLAQAPQKAPIQATIGPDTQVPTLQAQWQSDSTEGKFQVPGSFSLSCNSTILNGTILSADCQTISGKKYSERSKFDLNCAIANENGVLKWAIRATAANFRASSRNYYIVTGIGGDITLHAECMTIMGLYIDCSITLSEGIVNIDGKLSPRDSHECTYSSDVHLRTRRIR